MRCSLILLLLSICIFKAQTQINKIPGIEIIKDIDYMQGLKPIQYFHHDYVLIQSYFENQLWLSDGTDANTKMILEYKNIGNLVTIQVISNTAIVFIQSVKDSLLTIYCIQDTNIDLDTTWTIKGNIRDFNILGNKIYFTELDLNFGNNFTYYSYDIANKTVNKIMNKTKAALTTPFVWKNELYYIGSVSGSAGTSLARYLVNYDSLTTVTMLDSGYTFLNSNLVVQDKEFFYLFIPFIKSNFTEYHDYLVRSDGTQNGTYKIKEIRGPNVIPENETIIWKNHLYFNGSIPNDTIGSELYVSDGTSAGTKLVKDLSIDPNGGVSDFSPGNFLEFNDKLYFSSIYDFTLNPLYRSDGTQLGTKKIALEFSFIYGPISSMNDTLIFCGYNDFLPSIGNELFFYTSDGNIRYFDINKGSGNFGNSRLYQTIVTPNNVFFTIDDGSGVIHPYLYNKNGLINGSHQTTTDQNFLLYPNPVDGILYFDKNLDLKEISKISLISENGIEINLDNWNENKINTKTLLSGFYKILLYGKDKLKYSSSFIKVK